MWLQKPIFCCRSHNIAAVAMICLQDPRFGCRILGITFFLSQLNIFFKFMAAFPRIVLLVGKFYFSNSVSGGSHRCPPMLL